MSNNSYNDKKGGIEVKPVTLETVDKAVFDYFNQNLKLFVDGPDGRKKVETIFASGERFNLIRKQGFRDENGVLILPLLSITRTNVDRTKGFGGMAQETKSITVSKNIHQKTGNIQNLLEDRRLNGFPEENKKDKVIYEYLTIPFPDFGIANYEITIWTQFQQHANEILEKIFYAYNWQDSFVLPVDYSEAKTSEKGKGYYFVGFREGLTLNSQSNTEEFSNDQRIIKYNYTIKVPFYLILEPKDESLSYGRDETGKPVVYKYQNRPILSLKEQIVSNEEFAKLFNK